MREEYDWRRNGIRIECKSAQLMWVSANSSWRFCFTGIKLALDGAREQHLFDELLLALYTPIGVHFIRHNLELGVANQGISTSTRGHNIQVYAPVNEHDVHRALHVILRKFEKAGCQQLAVARW